MLRFEGVEDTPVAPTPHRSMTFEEACHRRSDGADVSVLMPEPSAPETPADNLGRVAAPFTREIKLWDSSMLPLGARSSSKDDYRAWPLQPAQPSPRAAFQPSPHKCEGTTTSQEAYRAWKLEPPPPSARAAYQPSPHKCEGTTTAQSAYQAWPLERAAQPSGRAPAASSGHKFNAISHNQDTYR